MKISASIQSQFNEHELLLKTNDTAKTLSIAPKPSGFGSSVNGAELLCLSLATCFCNDIYREAAKRNIKVSGVNVECTAEFAGDSEPGFNFTYKATVKSDESESVIQELIEHTDRIAEIHETLRKGVRVSLETD
jgi:uncharacterized OsmC-like protein